MSDLECAQCGHANPSEARFCMECGKATAMRCTSCDTELPPSAKFCSECGSAQAVAPPVTRDAAIYTPKHLADKILDMRSALEGERKQVTVMFVDIAGSMEIAESLGPEDWHQVLDRFFDIVGECIHRYEGTVNQYTGDGVMALFGAPVAHEDHAQRGCYAALDLRAELRDYVEELKRARSINLSFRIGVNSGDVVVGSIGDDLRMDYTAQGHTVGIAQRVEQLAAAESVYLAAATAALVDGYFQLRSLGEFDLKGVTSDVEVFVLEGLGESHTRLEVSRRRGFSTFVGRDTELSALASVREQVLQGTGRVVGVVAEAGTGKSRLCDEFIGVCRARKMPVYEAHCPAHGKTVPLLPVQDLLCGLLGISRTDDPALAREKIAGRLILLDPEFEGVLPYVFELVGVADSERPAPEIDPGTRLRRLYDFVRRLITLCAEQQPIVILVDDLHWIDAASDAFLAEIVEAVHDSATLLLLNFRPEYEAGWMRRSYFQQLPLVPLGVDAIGAMLAPRLGSDASISGLVQQIFERTGGNPFFAEEIVRSLIDAGVLVGSPGDFKIGSVLDEIGIPTTVHSILQARIDRLDEHEKLVLQTSAVIGDEFGFDLLDASVDLSTDELMKALDHLIAAELLHEASLYPTLRYTFKHALTYQVAHDSLLQDTRRTLHARIATSIEVLFADRLADFVDRLAHHCFAGQLWEKALKYQRDAGNAAAGRSIHDEAVVCFEAALEAVERLPDRPDLTPASIDTRFDLRNSLWALGQFDAIFDHLAASERAALTLNDADRLGWVSTYMCANLWITGRGSEVLPYVERATSIAGQLGDRALAVATEFYEGTAAATGGELKRCQGPFRHIQKLLADEAASERCGLPFFPAVVAGSWLVFAHAELGEFAQGLEEGRRAIDLAEQIEQPFGIVHSCYDLGYLCLVQGELADAIRLLTRAADLAAEWRLGFLAPITSGLLGCAYAQSGNVEEGFERLMQAESSLEALGATLLHSLIAVHTADAARELGELTVAKRYADKGLELSRQRRELGFEAAALRLQGVLAAEAGTFATAVERLDQARSLSGQLDMAPLLVRCDLDLARTLRLSGNRQDSLDLLDSVIIRARELSMPVLLAEAGEERTG